MCFTQATWAGWFLYRSCHRSPDSFVLPCLIFHYLKDYWKSLAAHLIWAIDFWIWLPMIYPASSSEETNLSCWDLELPFPNSDQLWHLMASPNSSIRPHLHFLHHLLKICYANRSRLNYFGSYSCWPYSSDLASKHLKQMKEQMISYHFGYHFDFAKHYWLQTH